jgi:hypothetical protein
MGFWQVNASLDAALTKRRCLAQPASAGLCLLDAGRPSPLKEPSATTINLIRPITKIETKASDKDRLVRVLGPSFTLSERVIFVKFMPPLSTTQCGGLRKLAADCISRSGNSCIRRLYEASPVQGRLVPRATHSRSDTHGAVHARARGCTLCRDRLPVGAVATMETPASSLGGYTRLRGCQCAGGSHFQCARHSTDENLAGASSALDSGGKSKNVDEVNKRLKRLITSRHSSVIFLLDDTIDSATSQAAHS